MENNCLDVIVIGGGPGGYCAALYAARANLSTMVIEKFAPGGQMATTDIVENYPGFAEGINGFDLAMQMKHGAERFGVKTKLAEVLSVELDKEVKLVHTKKATFEAKTVILALGASPRELGLENERMLRGRGISYCATCDGSFYRDKTVVIVGGGNTAVADAWNSDGNPGIVYTTDWEGKPIVHDRMHWTLAEEINSAAVLYRVTKKQKYADDYAMFMEYLDDKVLDHVNGSWFHQLDSNNQVIGTVWPGKSDIYHALQAVLIPYSVVDKSIALAVKQQGEV